MQRLKALCPRCEIAAGGLGGTLSPPVGPGQSLGRAWVELWQSRVQGGAWAEQSPGWSLGRAESRAEHGGPGGEVPPGSSANLSLLKINHLHASDNYKKLLKIV